MTNLLIEIYRFLFARSLFYNVNKLLYRLSLSGLGVLNYETVTVSGEARFLERYLKKKRDGIVIDVGSNVGNYSKKVLLVNSNLEVYGFEPHPVTYKKLTNNIVSKNFHPINAAVGDEVGILSLYDYAEKDGSTHASLFKDVIENIHRSKSTEHKVNVLTLGTFLEENNIDRVALLKIDTEGNELAVLKGLGKCISENRVDAIHFEFNEMNVSSRTFFRDFWELLPNYEFYRLLPTGLVKIEQYVPLFCEIFAYQNIVALLRHE